jgi:hypothetical protein
MLRITIHKETRVTRLSVEGRLTGEFVTELERCWRQETDTSKPNRIQIELRDVRFVSDEGRKLLQRMVQAGVQLTAADLVMKAIVEEIIA